MQPKYLLLKKFPQKSWQTFAAVYRIFSGVFHVSNFVSAMFILNVDSKKFALWKSMTFWTLSDLRTDSRKRHADVNWNFVSNCRIVDVKLWDDVGTHKSQELGNEEEKNEQARADGDDGAGRSWLG